MTITIPTADLTITMADKTITYGWYDVCIIPNDYLTQDSINELCTNAYLECWHVAYRAEFVFKVNFVTMTSIILGDLSIYSKSK